MQRLYDPQTNLIKEVTMKYLMELTGRSETYLRFRKNTGRKIESINCYLLKDDTTVQQRKEWHAQETFVNERWKMIEGSREEFMVSNYGRVKRLYKKHESFMLPTRPKPNGRLFIKARFKGDYKDYSRAKLVAHHFIRPAKPGEFLIHRNGVNTDDYVDNLEYITREEIGRRFGPRSRSRAVVQLDPDTMEMIDEFKSAREAGRKCYLSYQAVVNNCHGKTRLAGGMYKFMFSDEYEKLERERIEREGDSHA